MSMFEGSLIIYHVVAIVVHSKLLYSLLWDKSICCCAPGPGEPQLGLVPLLKRTMMTSLAVHAFLRTSSSRKLDECEWL